MHDEKDHILTSKNTISHIKLPALYESEPAFSVVFVIGMHRSGTSLTTRIVNIAGYTIGNSADIIGPDSGNPTGYWEHRSFVSLNRKIIACYLMPKFLSALFFSKLKKKAVELISSFKDCRKIALKDPIASITLPFWISAVREALPERDVKILVIICVRNPLDVSKSLQNRGLIITKINCGLWEKYISSAFKNSEGLPRHVVHYENYFDGECDNLINNLSSFLGINLTVEQALWIKSFIDPNLRESDIGDGIWRSNLSIGAKQLYLNLLKQKNKRIKNNGMLNLT